MEKEQDKKYYKGIWFAYIDGYSENNNETNEKAIRDLYRGTKELL